MPSDRLDQLSVAFGGFCQAMRSGVAQIVDCLLNAKCFAQLSDGLFNARVFQLFARQFIADDKLANPLGIIQNFIEALSKRQKQFLASFALRDPGAALAALVAENDLVPAEIQNVSDALASVDA